MSKREVLLNCRVEADHNGNAPTLVQDIADHIESISINLKRRGWKDGDKVRVIIERVGRRKGEVRGR